MPRVFDPGAQTWVDSADPAFNSFWTVGPGSPSYAGGASPSSTPPASRPSGAVAPQRAAGYSESAGGVPWVPDYNAILQSTLAANQANLPALQNYLGQVNAYQLGQVGVTPSMLQASGANISSNLAGQVDTSGIRRSAAERGIALGIPGSQFVGYGELTGQLDRELALQAQGQQQLNAAMGRTSSLVNPASFMASPEQLYQAQLLANIYASAPVPAARQAADMSALRSGMNRGYAGAGGGYSPGVVFPAYTQPTYRAPTVGTPQFTQGMQTRQTPGFGQLTANGDWNYVPTEQDLAGWESQFNDIWGDQGGYTGDEYYEPTQADWEDLLGSDIYNFEG